MGLLLELFKLPGSLGLHRRIEFVYQILRRASALLFAQFFICRGVYTFGEILSVSQPDTKCHSGANRHEILSLRSRMTNVAI